MNTNKYCKHCKTNDAETVYWKSSKTILADGSIKQYYECRKCAWQRMKQYRSTPQGYEASLRNKGNENRHNWPSTKLRKQRAAT